MHYPKTEEGKRELARRAASVHADMVGQCIRRLDCPSWQKDDLIDAIVKTVSGQLGKADKREI